jgi:hypothetical protein
MPNNNFSRNASTLLYRIFVIILLSIATKVAGQRIDSTKATYEATFHHLNEMLTGTQPVNFKTAVLSVEKAFQPEIDTSYVSEIIKGLSGRCFDFIKLYSLQYDYKDKPDVEKWAAIFKIMTDTIVIQNGNSIQAFIPFQYDFDDFFGENDWTKMFVSKLLETGSGNCHSLPYLYKMLAAEMGTTAQLALAPSHIYIKHRSVKTGMFNTELTSASFPIDAWIMTSGYIHLTAIQNGVFMKALNDKESIALCLIDLAEGYKRKTNNLDPDFIIKCSDKALEYFPNYVNALILKAETIKSQHDKLVVDNPNPTNEIKLKTQSLFNQMQELYVKVHKLGYRQMPKDMYMKWLVELKTEKEKYQNKNVSSYDK